MFLAKSDGRCEVFTTVLAQRSDELLVAMTRSSMQSSCCSRPHAPDIDSDIVIQSRNAFAARCLDAPLARYRDLLLPCRSTRVTALHLAATLMECYVSVKEISLRVLDQSHRRALLPPRRIRPPLICKTQNGGGERLG